LLELAEDATQRGWWEDYADALTSEYLEFIGLEAEAVSSLQWQADVVPGLFQTEGYARQLSAAFRTVDPTTTPSEAPPQTIEAGGWAGVIVRAGSSS